MILQFYRNCFLVGMAISITVGPIFILTFNRGAWHGFARGFATAFGAACGDGFLFSLGLLGVLKLLGKYAGTILVMDVLGGIFLIGLGIRSLKGRQKYVTAAHTESLPPVTTALKSFFLAIANPLSVLFFMVIEAQILPHEGFELGLRQIITGSTLVSAGSLTVLTGVAFTASHLGRAISERRLRIISQATGLVFLAIGVYFFGDFIVRIFKYLKA